MKLFGLSIAAVCVVLAAPAQAEPYKFTITGDYEAVFYVDSSPSAENAIEGAEFAVYDVPGFPDAATGVADLTFFSDDQGGGLQIHDYYGGAYLLVADGPQLYSGSESTPTLLTGDFALTEYLGTGSYSLTIAPSTGSAVPEPASWALMLGGFGALGGMMRERRTRAVRYA